MAKTDLPEAAPRTPEAPGWPPPRQRPTPPWVRNTACVAASEEAADPATSRARGQKEVPKKITVDGSAQQYYCPYCRGRMSAPMHCCQLCKTSLNLAPQSPPSSTSSLMFPSAVPPGTIVGHPHSGRDQPFNCGGRVQSSECRWWQWEEDPKTTPHGVWRCENPPYECFQEDTHEGWEALRDPTSKRPYWWNVQRNDWFWKSEWIRQKHNATKASPALQMSRNRPFPLEHRVPKARPTLHVRPRLPLPFHGLARGGKHTSSTSLSDAYP